MVPGYDEIAHMHKKYAPNEAAYDLIFKHCVIIAEIAQMLIDENSIVDIDVDFVRAGCLLHDIGVYPLYSKDGLVIDKAYIKHGIEGYAILKREGYSEDLCRVASHHTGVGLSRSDIKSQNLPLPDKNFFAETKEERLIMYADKFHSKTPKFNSFKGYMKTVSQYGDDKIIAFDRLAKEFGIPDLSRLSEKYGQDIL